MHAAQSIFQRSASNAGILALGNFGAVACNYLAVIYLARRLDKEMFGLFTYGQTLATYAILVADLGFAPYFSRTLARQSRLVEKNLIGIITAQASAGLAALMVLILLSAVLDPSHSPLVIAVVLISASSALVYPFAIDWYYLGNGRIAVYSISKFIQASTFLAGAAILVTAPHDVLLACSLRTISFVIAAIWLAHRLPASVCLKSVKGFHSTWHVFRTSAKWFWMSAVFVQLYNGLDIILLRFFGRASDLGLYSASFRLNALCLTPISLMNAAMLPLLSSESLETPQRFRAVMKHYIRLASSAALFIVVIAIFASNLVITFVYGHSYGQAGQYLRFLLLGSAALALNGAIAQPLLATGRERVVTFQVAVTALSCGLANFICIPKFGAMAASWVYLGAAILGTVWLLPAYRVLLRDGPAPGQQAPHPSQYEVDEVA